MAERQSRSRLHRTLLQRRESAMANRLEASNAPRHRRDAATCGLLAASAKSVADRELLQGMQRSLLRRADHEDRFDGSPPVPPARPRALAVPGRS